MHRWFNWFMNKNIKNTTHKHKKLRSFFSSIFGIAAVFFLMMSITVVWLNRTLIDTGTYVSTVAPLVTKPDVQIFIANKVSSQLVKNAPIQQLASALLPASDLNQGFSSAQLSNLVQPIVQSDVVNILKSSSFATLWKNTNQSAHTQFINQLNGTSPTLTLNLNPAINGIVSELKDSQLSAVADHISISSDTGTLVIKGKQVSKIRSYYNLFQLGTLAFVAATLICFGLASLIAVNHFKTIRRLLLVSGILTLIGAVILEIPQYINFKTHDLLTQNAIRSIVSTVVANLLLIDIIIGVLFIGTVIVSKIFISRRKAS